MARSIRGLLFESGGGTRPGQQGGGGFIVPPVERIFILTLEAVTRPPPRTYARTDSSVQQKRACMECVSDYNNPLQVHQLHCSYGIFCSRKKEQKCMLSSSYSSGEETRCVCNSDANRQTSAPYPNALNRDQLQKGGTTSLRGNLLTHPMVWGMQNEVHFFDLVPSR